MNGCLICNYDFSHNGNVANVQLELRIASQLKLITRFVRIDTEQWNTNGNGVFEFVPVRLSRTP